MQDVAYDLLDETDRKLVAAAIAARENSYAPHSDFYVGAAVLTKDDIIIKGTNFENAAFGSTVCAERIALYAANAQGYRQISKIAVTGDHKNGDGSEVVTPCGACRQVMKEFRDIAGRDLEIIMISPDNRNIRISSIDELLPAAFGPANLGMNAAEYKAEVKTY